MKTIFRWSPRFQHWYFIGPWVADHPMARFNVELNRLNGKRS